MKELIGKGKHSLPEHLILIIGANFDQKATANGFNEYFVNVGLKLACKIPDSQR